MADLTTPEMRSPDMLGTGRTVCRRYGGGQAAFMTSDKWFDTEGGVATMGEGNFRVRRASQPTASEPA